MDTKEKNTLVGHLDELRFRLLFILVLILVLSISAFIFSDEIADYFIKIFLLPNKISLHFFSITEPFTFKMKLSFLVALYAAFPLIMLQVWLFVKPALYHSERFFLKSILLISVFLFYTGSLCCFFLLLPYSISALLNFAPPGLNNTINADSFLNFIFYTILIFGLIFELPVVITALTRFGIIDYRFLTSKRKYIIVAIWIFSALIMPPDVISMSMGAIPLMLLFEVSVLVSWIIHKRKNKQHKRMKE